MPVVIKPIAFEEIPGFRNLLDTVAREQIYLVLLEAPPLENIERAIRNNTERNGVNLIATDADTMVGWCDISARMEPGSSHVGRLGMGILAGYRRQGIGRRLLAAALERAKAAGFIRVELEVFSSNHAAIHLYKRSGFIVEGTRKRARYLNDAWEDAIQMAQFPQLSSPYQPAEAMKKDALLSRIERESGVPGLKDLLCSLPPSDLQSLLLEVYRDGSRRRRPADLLADFQKNRFVRPGKVSPAVLVRWESLAIELLPASFETMELSPCCPLGTNSVVAAVDPNWAVPTARNVEVVSDPTNVLALASAVRRRQMLSAGLKAKTVNLAACHRVLRPQRYSSPDALSHFSLFALSSAGRDIGNRRFEIDTLAVHLRFYVSLLRSYLGAERRLTVLLTDFGAGSAKQVLERELLEPLRRESSNLNCIFDDQRTSGRGYYRDLCFKIHVEDTAGEQIEVADGGSVDWTQKLLSDAKERLLVSGIDSERICDLFTPRAPAR